MQTQRIQRQLNEEQHSKLPGEEKSMQISVDFKVFEENHWKVIGVVTLDFDNLPIVIVEKKYRSRGI